MQLSTPGGCGIHHTLCKKRLAIPDQLVCSGVYCYIAEVRLQDITPSFFIIMSLILTMSAYTNGNEHLISICIISKACNGNKLLGMMRQLLWLLI